MMWLSFLLSAVMFRLMSGDLTALSPIPLLGAFDLCHFGKSGLNSRPPIWLRPSFAGSRPRPYLCHFRAAKRGNVAKYRRLSREPPTRSIIITEIIRNLHLTVIEFAVTQSQEVLWHFLHFLPHRTLVEEVRWRWQMGKGWKLNKKAHDLFALLHVCNLCFAVGRGK